MGRAMTDDDALAAFEAERPRLRGLAYRMLGSLSDADDVVQDTWVRWQGLVPAARDAVERPAAWWTTVASRRALDVLKSAQRQREQYVGPWLPEPLLTDGDPADALEWAESLTLGFLVVLERLAPVERAVFLLADVFGEPYSAIAAVVDRSEEACRQIASRARQRVRDERRHVAPSTGTTTADELVQAFLAACAFHQVDDLRRILADDVVLVSDGGRDVHAARRPVQGADRVSRFLVNVVARIDPSVTVELHRVNGEPGLLVRRGSAASMVVAFEVLDERIVAVRLVLNPAKLHHLTTP
ncbi:MAG: hypothetical protein RL238_2442 [Actinomycetota bacterium]|jgi:RNA polymerase sigma-70 factor (ECF subfamily)